jgi:LuxR family transcriptional regulator, maltose regulon positive regulatory protein
MLVRQRLLDRLRARWFIPVTVVSAPAGYGKTTLLAQAVEANAAAPLGVDRWLTCGSDERIAARLGRALSLAVGATPPDDEGLDIGDHLRVVIDGLWQWSPRQVALLVDDAQEIPPGSEAAVLLTRLANELPANTHLVVASRGQPPVPLSRLDVEGRVVHLGQDDLAFTGDELAQFARLRGVAGSTVTSSVGWPALVELSASASTELVSDYVGQEVLSRIAPIQRRQLAVLAHVGNVDRDLARAVLGPNVDATSLVEGLPLVTRLPNGEWSLHALWRSLLANDLTPGELEEVRHDAGVLVRERGELTAAVWLFI